MFSLQKLVEPEWYFRKYVFFVSKFVSKEYVENLLLVHRTKLVYHNTFHKKLHLNHPKNLSEKLLWLSLYWRHPLKTECADKVKMRKYVKEKGLEHILTPIIGVYNSPYDIPFEKLPNRFVLKCNHGCGYNVLIKDKATISIDEVRYRLQHWLSSEYQGGLTELQYRDIMPRLILCEEYLPSLGSYSIIDYKIHCFNGYPDFVLVCYDRDQEEKAQLATFDFSWHQLYYVVNEKTFSLSAPKSLNKMIAYSRTLSHLFPFVRVDFYDVDGSPILGELTFTPYGNMIDYYKPEILIELGKKLRLPSKYHI